MASNAWAAYGTTFARGASPSTPTQTFTTVGDVKNVDGPSTEVSVIDVTTHSSAASGNYREKIPSLIDPGEITIELNWVPSDSAQQNLLADMTSRTLRQWKIQTPANPSTPASSANMVFNGYVTQFAKTFPTDDVMGANVTITITGAITTTVT